MKKDLFKGNIKKEYVSYIWGTLIVEAVIFFGLGAFFTGLSFSDAVADRATAMFLLALGVISIAVGIIHIGGSIFTIRTYPKHQKYVKLFFNSEIYFSGSETDEYFGPEGGRVGRRGRIAHHAVTMIAEQEKQFEGIAYPKEMKKYTILSVICWVFSVLFFVATRLVMNNMELLPLSLQNEELLNNIALVVVLLTMAMSAFFAFRVRKLREQTRREFMEEHFFDDQPE